MDRVASDFPIAVTFQRLPGTQVFKSKEDIGEWLNKERAFWNRLSSGNTDQSTIIVNNNLNLIKNINTDLPVDSLIELITSVSDTYYPAFAGGESPIVGLGNRDANLAKLAFLEFSTPGSLIINQVNSQQMQFIEPKIVAYIMRLCGNPGALLDRVYKLHGDMENWGVIYSESTKNFDQLIEKCEKDWLLKIDGYEAKVALSAPREYWGNRSVNHEKYAKKDKMWWSWSLAVFIILWCLSGYYVFKSETDSSSPVVQILFFIKHFVIFGTFMGCGVWWLRQKLRDARSHEHLAQDAAERVTMIETYAAMKGAGLESGDLSPILMALYRPAATGLIEDSGPVLPVEILMKSFGDAASKMK